METSDETIEVNLLQQRELDLKATKWAKLPNSSELQDLKGSESSTDLCEKLKQFGISDDTCKALRDKDHTGASFFKLRPKELKTVVTNIEEQQRLLQIISSETLANCKIFMDPVHGEIKMHPLLTRIIDRRELQRLRDIKQLGGAYKVYSGASHNRFEHSLGVCHLAGLFGRTLKEDQPEHVDDKDILCLQIAGLCHEIGQGPFSRLFDQYVIPHVENPKSKSHSAGGRSVRTPTEGSHAGDQSHGVGDPGSPKSADEIANEGGRGQEECGNSGRSRYHWVRTVSAEIFQCIAKDLEEDFEFYGLTQRHDAGFIKALINPPDNNVQRKNALERFRRNKNKLYLFEIVCNRINGIDVDRLDYLARDSYQTGLKTGFDYKRLLMHMRILQCDDSFELCFRDKVAANIYDMYQTRYQLYRSVYMHQPTMVIQLMIAEAFKLASDVKLFHRKQSGRSQRNAYNADSSRSSPAMSDWSIADVICEVREALQNAEKADESAQKAKESAFKKYQQLTDSLYYRILFSWEDELRPARKLLERVEKRKLFSLVGKTEPTESHECPWTTDDYCNLTLTEKEAMLTAEILKCASGKRTHGEQVLNEKTLIVKIVSIGYGNTGVSPSYGVKYYTKYDCNHSNAQVPPPPTDFKNRTDMHLRVFFVEKSQSLLNVAREAFGKYCRKTGIKCAPVPEHPGHSDEKTPRLSTPADDNPHGN